MVSKYKLFKINVLGSILILLVVFCGCGRVSKLTKDQISLNINSSFSVEEEQKVQAGFNSSVHSVARGPEGYYFIENMSLNYHDISMNKSIALCSRPNCMHEVGNKECMAYTTSNNVFYHNNYIYITNWNSQGVEELVRIDPDGENRKVIGEMCSNPDGTSVTMTICKDTAYFIIPSDDSMDKEKTVSIKSMSLIDGKNKDVYSHTGINFSIKSLFSYGDNVYFIMTSAVENDTGGYQIKGLGLYCIDNLTGNCTNISEEDIVSYCYDYVNDYLYMYISAKGLYKYNFQTKESTLVFEASDECLTADVSFDGNYIYMSNSGWVVYSNSFYKLGKDINHKIWIFNKDNELISEMVINDARRVTVFFGDTDYLFLKKSDGAMSGIYKISKKDLKDIVWEKL